jgi:hypothetical protein
MTTSVESIDKSVLTYLKKIDEKLNSLEQITKKLSCYGTENRPPKKKESAYNIFVKANWNHQAFQNLDSLSRMSAIGLAWTNQKTQPNRKLHDKNSELTKRIGTIRVSKNSIH